MKHNELPIHWKSFNEALIIQKTIQEAMHDSYKIPKYYVHLLPKPQISFTRVHLIPANVHPRCTESRKYPTTCVHRVFYFETKSNPRRERENPPHGALQCQETRRRRHPNDIIYKRVARRYYQKPPLIREGQRQLAVDTPLSLYPHPLVLSFRMLGITAI